MFIAILIGVFLTVVFIILSVYSVFFSTRVITANRLEKYATVDNKENPKIENKNHGTYLFRLFGFLGKLLSSYIHLNKIKKKLMQAEILMKPEEFLGASLISAILLALLIYLIFKSVVIALIFLPVGYFIPYLIVVRKKSKRMAKINSQLPEALNIISNGLRAGYSFIQSIEIVTKEGSGPICDEFNKVIRDNILGKSIEEALTSMSERTDDEDLDMVITALIIQRQVGGNLAEVLDSISQTIRERVKIKNDVKTLTAQGKISSIIVSLLPIVLAIGLSIINPDYLTPLFATNIGKFIVIIGVVLQLIGIFILKKLVDIKV